MKILQANKRVRPSTFYSVVDTSGGGSDSLFCLETIMPTPNRTCQICDSPFYASPGHVRQGGGKYCSIACRTIAWQGDRHPSWRGGLTTRICERCEQTFQIKPSHVSKGEGKYCSQACHWDGKSQQMVCQQCGKTFSVPNSR